MRVRLEIGIAETRHLGLGARELDDVRPITRLSITAVRAPDNLPDASAVFAGIIAVHDKADLAHAVHEGVTFHCHDGMLSQSAVGVPIDDTTAVGDRVIFTRQPSEATTIEPSVTSREALLERFAAYRNLSFNSGHGLSASPATAANFAREAFR